MESNGENIECIWSIAEFSKNGYETLHHYSTVDMF